MSDIWYGGEAGESCFRCLAGLAVLLGLSGCAGSVPSKAGSGSTGEYAALERAVFTETNRMRSDPKAYTAFLQEIENRISGKVYMPKNSDVGIVTREGKSAVREAIAVLEKQQRLSRLKWSEALAELARAHVRDTGEKGLTGHAGSRGASFSDRVSAVAEKLRFTYTAENISYGFNNGREVVSQLIIDDGVPSRGHRKNMLTEALKYSGVGCGYHREYRHMCVVIYADGP